MNYTIKKFKIIISVSIIILIFIINVLTSYYSPSVSNEHLDRIHSIDWSMENLNEYGFRFDGSKALLTINDNEGNVCYITITENDEADSKMKNYNDMQYYVRRVQFGVFDIRRYLNSHHISDYYTFVCDGMHIEVSEHAFVKSKQFFLEFVNQINNGEEKIELYQTGFAKYCG